MLLGAVAALCSAALWAAGSVIYTVAGRKITALELNLIKGVAAIAMLVATVVLLQRPLPTASWAVWVYLPLSGIAGIALSDTFLLEGFKLIGPRRVLLIKTVTPPLTALVAMLTLGEFLAPTNWLGIILVAIGVAWVITERTAADQLPWLVGAWFSACLLPPAKR
ncbi:MAG: DMT family transporter [Synechococcaceae cyanobacterium SM2_3_60]|nr:DMT family transporter [Synechococcaceae cyanobacterium SM2_3_60]